MKSELERKIDLLNDRLERYNKFQHQEWQEEQENHKILSVFHLRPNQNCGFPENALAKLSGLSLRKTRRCLGELLSEGKITTGRLNGKGKEVYFLNIHHWEYPRKKSHGL
jgi:hypothetical protein